MRHAGRGGRHLLPTQRQSHTRRQRQKELLQTRWRPSDVAQRVQAVGGHKLQHPVVLRELRAAPLHEARPRHPRAAPRASRARRDRAAVFAQRARRHAQGHHLGLLHSGGPPQQVGQLRHAQAPPHSRDAPTEQSVWLPAGPQVRRLHRAGPHHQGVHAQRHRDQTRVATRGRTPLLQGQRSRLRRQDAQGAQGVSNGGCKQRHLDGMEVGGRQTSLIRVCPRWLASMPSVWSSCLPAGCLSTSLCAHTHTHADGYGGWGECLDKRAWTLIRLSRYVWGGAPACLSVSINQSVCI
mmetsp:Transcript_26683/g.76525  ORF Transcript_26683/g.76525 Transcript_26683/m.76525 type:complete len:295 (+) Transcript_26683:1109-1993(+)